VIISTLLELLSARITIVKPKVKPPNSAGKIFNRDLNNDCKTGPHRSNNLAGSYYFNIPLGGSLYYCQTSIGIKLIVLRYGTIMLRYGTSKK